MKLYLVNRIIDRRPYIITVSQSKDIAIKHVEAACAFIRGDNLEIRKKRAMILSGITKMNLDTQSLHVNQILN